MTLSICFLPTYNSYIINNKFNLPSDLVPLMGPRRLIPMVKTQYIRWKKPIFWVNKKPLRETWEVILLDSICITLTGGKTLLGYCFKTPFARKCLKYLFCPIYLLNHLLYLYIACIEIYAYPSPTPPYIYILLTIPLFTA